MYIPINMIPRRALILLLFLCHLPLIAQEPFETDTLDFPLQFENENDTLGVDEQFILDIDSLWSEFRNRTAYYEEDGTSLSANPEFPDSIYIERLASLPRIIEMPYNGIIRNHIDFYLERNRNWVELMLGLSKHMLPMFEQELDAQGLPLELRYLPIIESALNPNAVSRAGATGLWQLMLNTGRSLGLDVNSLVDERRDPLLSTKAAVRFLKELHAIYGDWNLAIAAYNCGPGNVNRAIRNAGGKTDFWTIYYYLPRETRGYVPAFIAANYVMEYYKEHGIRAMRNPYPVHCDTVMIDRMIHFEQVSQLLDISTEQLKRMNPMFRKQIVPGNLKPYALLLPADSTTPFIEKIDTIASHRQDELLVNIRRTVDPSAGRYQSAFTDSVIYHKVTKGQSLAAVASKYRVTQDNLRNWNNLRTSRVREGHNLLVFVRSSTRRSGSTTAQSSAAAPRSIVDADGNTIYTVRSGDSFWRIANQYSGVTMNDIMRANNLTSNSKLSIGQKLIIPVN